MPERIAHLFEFAVGIMLVLLGADLLRRLIVARVHFHMHRHVDGTTHLHAHSHAGEADHAGSRNDHVHARGLPLRALTVGLMHGLAGSAALILLTAGTDRLASLGARLPSRPLFQSRELCSRTYRPASAAQPAGPFGVSRHQLPVGRPCPAGQCTSGNDQPRSLSSVTHAANSQVSSSRVHPNAATCRARREAL